MCIPRPISNFDFRELKRYCGNTRNNTRINGPLVFYAVRFVSKERRWSILPRMSCYTSIYATRWSQDSQEIFIEWTTLTLTLKGLYSVVYCWTETESLLKKFLEETSCFWVRQRRIRLHLCVQRYLWPCCGFAPSSKKKKFETRWRKVKTEYRIQSGGRPVPGYQVFWTNKRSTL
jgi:hypothetical protein